MKPSVVHDPVRVAFELREQLSSDKRRLAFFFGAGTSMSVGIPGIGKLTEGVKDKLQGPEKERFISILSTVDTVVSPNVEDALNRVRLYRELIGKSTRIIDGLSKDAATALDVAICKAIYDFVCVEPSKDIKPHLTLAQWLHAQHGNRDNPVEIFTINYDLLLERAMEKVGLPFFDGFVGSVAPFFAPQLVETDGAKGSEGICPPRAWTRLWKLHGSINWHLIKEASESTPRIARLTGGETKSGGELMIFPSRDKYTDSRKLPYLTYQDRLRKFLSSGEALLVVVGYSFSDDHLNEIVFQGLRSNNRLAVIALIYGINAEHPNLDKLILPEKMISYGQQYRNLMIYGPDKACIGGIQGEWSEPSKRWNGKEAWPFWDDTNRRFILGDFDAFASYLERFIGFHASNVHSGLDSLLKHSDSKEALV